MVRTSDATQRQLGTLRGVATRQYGQYCAVAKALDVLGDRWALLIVRELLFAPLRYSDLQAALPGIATDMLASRLRELEASGVIARGLDDPRQYELTDRGRALRPVLEALAVWGLGELTKRTRDEAFDARWMALPLSGMLRPDRATGVMLSIKLVVDGDEVAIRVHDGQVSFTHPDDPADVTIEGPADALVAAVTTPGTRAQRLRVDGERRQVDELLYLLGLTDTTPRRRRPRQ
jgi:DNA-binding HxlR family transcriptional regulator